MKLRIRHLLLVLSLLLAYGLLLKAYLNTHLQQLHQQQEQQQPPQNVVAQDHHSSDGDAHGDDATRQRRKGGPANDPTPLPRPPLTKAPLPPLHGDDEHENSDDDETNAKVKKGIGHSQHHHRGHLKSHDFGIKHKKNFIEADLSLKGEAVAQILEASRQQVQLDKKNAQLHPASTQDPHSPSWKKKHQRKDDDQGSTSNNKEQRAVAAAATTTVHHPDIQLFVIWGGAMHKAKEILKDIATKFLVLEIRMFRWEDTVGDDGGDSAHHEAGGTSSHDSNIPKGVVLSNLWRLYSGKGQWERKNMPLKVKQCGRGNFIALVVVDPEPEYKVEHTAHGDDVVSRKMHENKKRYRSMTGGGFKVHGTYNPIEAQHDISLLFHKRKEFFFERMVQEEEEEEEKVGSNGGGHSDAGASHHSHSSVAALTSRFLEAGDSIGMFDRENKHKKFSEEELSALHAYEHNAEPSKRNGDGEGMKDSMMKFYTTDHTHGYDGFRSCGDLLFSLDSVPDVSFYTTTKTESERRWLNRHHCDSWPHDVTILMQNEFQWAIISILNGQPAPGQIPADPAKRKKFGPPHVFDVKVGAMEHRFTMMHVETIPSGGLLPGVPEFVA